MYSEFYAIYSGLFLELHELNNLLFSYFFHNLQEHISVVCSDLIIKTLYTLPYHPKLEGLLYK